MIVIFIDKIEDFLFFLDKRIMDEIFYEIKEVKTQSDLSSKLDKEVIFHFLAKVGETLILYETKHLFPVVKEKEDWDGLIATIQNIFSQVNPNLKIVKGKIREIFLSYSH